MNKAEQWHIQLDTQHSQTQQSDTQITAEIMQTYELKICHSTI